MNDFNRDFSFQAFGVAVTGSLDDGLPNTDGSIDLPSSAVGFDFIASTRTYSMRYNGDTLIAQTMLGREDEGLQSLSTDRFSDASTLLVRSTGRDRYKYAGVVYWTTNKATTTDVPNVSIRKRRMVFGSRTLPRDIPSSGQSKYTGNIAYPSITKETSNGLLGNSGLDLTIDWKQGKLTGTGQVLNLFTPGIDTHFSSTTFTIDATVDRSTGRITGSVPSGVYGGPQRIEGALFGPNAAELGFVILDTDGRGRPVAAAALAAKQ